MRASLAGRRGEVLVGVYCASKAAVISLTQSAGLNLIEHGSNVNAIAPGVIEGEHWEHVDALSAKHERRPLGEKQCLVGEAVPYRRRGRAEDLPVWRCSSPPTRRTTSSRKRATSTAVIG